MWYTKFGPSGDVVLSSRIRLARNISGIPFTSRMSREQESKVIDLCRQALPEMTYIDFSSMTKTEILALSECHLVSPEMIENKKRCGIFYGFQIHRGSNSSYKGC